MRIGPYEISITKRAPSNLSSVESRGGWWPLIREPYAGAWQNDDEETVDTVVQHAVVFACVTLIASDIAKMRLRLVEQDQNQIWKEVENAAFSPVLRKPNRYQNRIQFFFWWMASKLLHGNTYSLKQRDQREVVTALYILDPTRVRPLVAPDGSVYYELKRDNLSGLRTEDVVIVPASEVIHDVGYPLFHPLVGVSPLYACSAAAVEGIRIQRNSSSFFANGSKPGGVLTAPGTITPETAARMKAYWEESFTGTNSGKVAVLGDGLQYTAMAMSARDSQLVDQLKLTGQDICTSYRVPNYKVGVGPPPSYNNVEALDQQYYSQCLQFHIESLELVMDEGLGLAPNKINGQRLGVEFDLDDLLRMDTATLIKAEKEATGIKSPNESRMRLNLPPVVGGDSPMAQQQFFSLAALAERDKDKPFSKPDAATPATPATAPNAPQDAPDDTKTFAGLLMTRAAQIATKHAA